MNANPQAEARYRKLVRTVRAFVAVALVTATIALLAGMLAAEAAGRWASFAVASSAFAALASGALAVSTLRDMRREAGGPDHPWVGDELERFVRDVLLGTQ